MPKTDRVFKPIFPKDLDRVLGVRYFSATQIAEKSGLTEDQKNATVKYLLRNDFIELWYAVKCPSCTYMWPLTPDEKKIPKKIFCPMCNDTFGQKEGTYYEVYHMLREP